MAINPGWIYVLGGIVFSSLAQILLKRATFLEAKETYWLLSVGASSFCYLISFAAYYLALRQFSISKISPVMTVGVVLIVVAYGYWMGESITARQSLGVLFGIIAIILILT